MVSRCLSVTRFSSLSFVLQASNLRLLAVALPCILQRNCQRSVPSFQTLPETTAKPSYSPYPFSCFKQWSRSSKRSPVTGERSQAGERALTALNQADLACSGNAWYVGEASISIAKLQHHKILYRNSDGEVVGRQAGFITAMWLHFCVPYTAAKPQ